MDPTTVPHLLTAYVFPAARALLAAVAILVAGWLLGKSANRLVRRFFQAREMDVALGGFLASAFQYAVIAASVITALGAVGIQTTSLVAIFASAGFAVGLALQGSLESFASGVMILFFRPFDLDHKISAAGQTGVVRDIGLFATTLVTADNEVILIPNKEITKGSIVNFSAQGTLRGGVVVHLAWGNDPESLRDLLLGAAKKCDLVLSDPAPDVVVSSVAKGLEMTIHVWAKSTDLGPALSRVRTLVHDALLAARVEIEPDAVAVMRA